MNRTAISIQGLSKQYRLGVVGTGTVSRDLNRWWARIRGKEDPTLKVTESNDRTQKGHSDFIWALENIDLEIREGESLGIIGRNGAGKSTLLKILSRVTAPTAGMIKAKGRIASLLEVGTGFHPELTGRENIYLNGAIMGMSKKDVSTKLDGIIDFSGCDRYVDTPVKRYSSGMTVRLGFAIAAYLEPEVLVVDEVLAVGDMEFQKKCLGKMSEVASGGRTVLFVSHNIPAVERLCDRVAWLDKGRLLEVGPTVEILPKYLANTLQQKCSVKWDSPNDAPGSAYVKLHAASVRVKDSPEAVIRTDEAVEVIFSYWNYNSGSKLNLSVLLSGKDGSVVFNTLSCLEEGWQSHPFEKGLFRSSFTIPENFLNDGRHSVSVLVVENAGSVLFRCDDILVFDVADSPKVRGGWYGEWIGATRPWLKWETKKTGSLDFPEGVD